MVGATDRCRVCDAPQTPGATFCPHWGARVEGDIDDDAAMTGRVADDKRSRGMWLFVTAVVAGRRDRRRRRDRARDHERRREGIVDDTVTRTG
jgi:hypothetical protein